MAKAADRSAKDKQMASALKSARRRASHRALPPLLRRNSERHVRRLRGRVALGTLHPSVSQVSAHHQVRDWPAGILLTGHFLC